MKNARLQWNRPSLIAFISNPKAKIPGNRMAYAGQKNPAAAAAIADYLLSLKCRLHRLRPANAGTGVPEKRSVEIAHHHATHNQMMIGITSRRENDHLEQR